MRVVVHGEIVGVAVLRRSGCAVRLRRVRSEGVGVLVGGGGGVEDGLLGAEELGLCQGRVHEVGRDVRRDERVGKVRKRGECEERETRTHVLKLVKERRGKGSKEETEEEGEEEERDVDLCILRTQTTTSGESVFLNLNSSKSRKTHVCPARPVRSTIIADGTSRDETAANVVRI